MANYEVIVVEDGEKAIETVVRENPILSCLTLCCENGRFSVCGAEVQEDTNSIPIIILTARWKKAVGAPWKRADSYMTKPFRPEELWQEIKNFLEIVL